MSHLSSDPPIQAVMNDRIIGPSSILSLAHISNRLSVRNSSKWRHFFRIARIAYGIYDKHSIPKKRKILPGFCMYGTRLTGDREERRGLKAALGDMVGTSVGGTFEIAASQSRHLSQSTAVDILSSESSCGIPRVPLHFFSPCLFFPLCSCSTNWSLGSFSRNKKIKRNSELVRDRYLSCVSSALFSGFCPYFPLHTFRGNARVRARSSLTFCISMSTEGSSYGDVGAWVAWRMRTFFIPCLASCIIFMPNRGEMVFFGRGKRNCRREGNLLLKGKETRHLYYFASIRLDSLQVCF